MEANDYAALRLWYSCVKTHILLEQHGPFSSPFPNQIEWLEGVSYRALFKVLARKMLYYLQQVHVQSDRSCRLKGTQAKPSKRVSLMLRNRVSHALCENGLYIWTE